MAPNEQRKKYVKSFTLLSLICYFLIIILAVQLAFSSAYLIYNNDTSLIKNLTNTFLSGYTIGILLLCFSSVMMSTMDSMVNSASVLLAKNILPKSLSENHTFITLCFSSLAIGGITALLVSQATDFILSILHYIKALGLLTSFSLFLGIIRFKIKAYTFWISMFITIMMTILTEIFKDVFLQYQAAFLRNFSGIILLLISNKTSINFKTPTLFGKNTFSVIYNLSKRGYNYFCKMLYDIPPISNYLLLAFSICLLVFTLLPPPYYSFPMREYQFLLVLRAIGACFVLAIILRSLWHQRIKLYYPIFLHIALTYCLIFLPTFCVLSSNFAVGYVIQLILGPLLLTFILHGVNTLWVVIAGNILTILFYGKLFGWEKVSFSSYNFQITIYAVFFIGIMLSVLFKVKDKMLQNREKALISLPEKLASNIGLAYLAPHLFKLRIDIIDLKNQINKDIKNIKLDTQLELDNYNAQFDKLLKYAQDELGYELVRKAHLFAYKDNQPTQERYYSVQSAIATATDIYTHIHIKNPHDRFLQLKDMETDFVAFAHPKELSHLIWCIIENLIQYDKKRDVKIMFDIEKEPLSIKMRTTRQLIPIEEMEDWINFVLLDTKESVEFGMGIVRKKLYEKYRITVIHYTTANFNEIILRCPKIPLEVVSCLTDKFGRLDFVNSNLRNPKRFSPWK